MPQYIIMSGVLCTYAKKLPTINIHVITIIGFMLSYVVDGRNLQLLPVTP